METPLSFPDSSFTETLIRVNELEKKDFFQWLFDPAMLFNAQYKWWGDRGKRKTRHEGLDLCLYQDSIGNIRQLGADTAIPAIGEGVVVKIADDFLGMSLFIEQTLSSGEDSSLLILYGHTTPVQGLRVGHGIKQGDVLATISDISPDKTAILPHLHISLGWISRPVAYDRLDWETIGKRTSVNLVDPLSLLAWNFEIQDVPGIT